MTLLDSLNALLAKQRAAGGEPTDLHMHPIDVDAWERPALEAWCHENGIDLHLTEEVGPGMIYLTGPPDPDWLLGNKGR